MQRPGAQLRLACLKSAAQSHAFLSQPGPATPALTELVGITGRPCHGLAYGQTGGWGNLNLPLQFFISVKRPAAPGVAMLAGYGITTGAYGAGSISYVDLSGLPGQVTDHDIRSTLLNLLPVNAVAWLQII
jgi:hypothetical protein